MKDNFFTTNITTSSQYSLANSLVGSNVLFKVLSEQSETPQQALDAAAQEIEDAK